jgi:hypothetical protein
MRQKVASLANKLKRILGLRTQFRLNIAFIGILP